VACGACVPACPNRLRRVAGQRLTARQLADRLLADAPYYAATGGGVTFSGGEPLAQPAFVLETVGLLGPGVHKALETSGYAPQAVFEAFCGAFDLVMLDLKQMDDAAHRRCTGVSNASILRNAALLCRGKTPFIVRIPLIPGVNDGADHARAVTRLVAGAPALLRVELLPYHRTAGAKYAMLGKPYEPGFDTERPVVPQLAIFKEFGIRSCVL
jgi:pyruvate formate lyase activating enzyme